MNRLVKIKNFKLSLTIEEKSHGETGEQYKIAKAAKHQVIKYILMKILIKPTDF